MWSVKTINFAIFSHPAGWLIKYGLNFNCAYVNWNSGKEWDSPCNWSVSSSNCAMSFWKTAHWYRLQPRAGVRIHIYLPDSLSKEVPYTGEYSSPFYFRLFRPQCLRANKTRRILMYYTCITGPNLLQAKRSENKQGIQYIDSG